MYEKVGKGDWIEFEPSFFTMGTKHGKVVGFDSTLGVYEVDAQGEKHLVPKKRIKKKLSFAQIMFG
jgi:hypothetical protein